MAATRAKISAILRIILNLPFTVVGGLVWVGVCTLAGYGFGTVPIVQRNFSLFALGIVFVSVIPIGIEMLRSRRARTSGGS